MKKYGVYKLISETKFDPATANDAYLASMIDSSPVLLKQFDDLNDAMEELAKHQSDKREYHYVNTVWENEIYYLALNQNGGDDEDEQIWDGDIIYFSEFPKEDEEEA